MKVTPFTRKAAIALAAKHQNLVGKRYKDEHGIEHTVYYVLPAPGHDATRMHLVLICYNTIDEVPEFSLDVANNLIEDYAGDDFDVVLISRNNLEFGDLGETLPIQLLATGDTLEYGFIIEPLP